jgi:hypothetical protein
VQGPHVGEQLSLEDWRDRYHGLDFNNDAFIDNQIRPEAFLNAHFIENE